MMELYLAFYCPLSSNLHLPHTPIDSLQFQANPDQCNKCTSGPGTNIHLCPTVLSPRIISKEKVLWIHHLDPHLCANSAFARDLVGKTPLGIALKHVLRCPLEVSCTQAVVAYRDSVIYNSHSLPHWYFLGSHAK